MGKQILLCQISATSPIRPFTVGIVSPVARRDNVCKTLSTTFGRPILGCSTGSAAAWRLTVGGESALWDFLRPLTKQGIASKHPRQECSASTPLSVRQPRAGPGIAPRLLRPRAQTRRAVSGPGGVRAPPRGARARGCATRRFRWCTRGASRPAGRYRPVLRPQCDPRPSRTGAQAASRW